MLTVIPQLESRLIGIMADRIRETAKADLQHEKLAARGKLSAGLAHELNNPAAAIAQSAVMLREKLVQLLGTENDAVEREIDLHKGLDNTLLILGHQLKHGIKVTRSYDPAVPCCSRTAAS